MAATKYTYSIVNDTVNGAVSTGKLITEIEQSADITVSLDYANGPINTNDDILDIWFLNSLLSGEQTALTNLVTAHNGVPSELPQDVNVIGTGSNLDKDGNLQSSVIIPYQESAKSFVTVDWADKTTWWYDSIDITDEVLTDSGDGLTFNSINTFWINLQRVYNRSGITGKDVIVKINDVETSTGFTIDHISGTITFSSSQSGNTIKTSYSHPNSDVYCIIPSAGKCIKIPRVKTQFTKGVAFPANFKGIVFEVIYNGPAISAMGIPANTDVAVKTVTYYNANNFVVSCDSVEIGSAFGELTKDFNVFHWEYLSGYLIKPPGDPTTDLSKNEFNKLKIYLKDSTQVLTGFEIASASFECYVEDL